VAHRDKQTRNDDIDPAQEIRRFSYIG